MLLDRQEYEKRLALYEPLTWSTHGEAKCNGMSRALIETGYHAYLTIRVLPEMRDLSMW